MDEKPIDAVALGLKRGPRGAFGVALLMLAVLAVVVATRAESVTVAPQPEPESEPVVAPIAPAKKAKSVTTKRKKVVAAAPPPKTVVVEQPKPVVPAPIVEEPKVQPAPVVVEKAVEVEQPKLVAPEPIAEKPKVAVAAEPLSPTQVVVEKRSAVAEEPLSPPPAPPAEPTEETAEQDGNGLAIARAIAAAKHKAVRECFERELKQTPKLRGTVVVELDLAPPNKVNDVRVNDDLERPAFTACVNATMHDVHFGALDEEISVRVPYNLTPQSK